MTAFKQLRKTLGKITLQAICLVMVTAIALGGVWTADAMAVGSEKAAAVVNDRAATELDRMAGAGTSDKLEGAVDGTIGKVKRGVADLTEITDDSLGDKLDTATDKLGGAADELKGKAKRDIGRTKGAAADAADDVEDGAEGIVESIKDFFD